MTNNASDPWAPIGDPFRMSFSALLWDSLWESFGDSLRGSLLDSLWVSFGDLLWDVVGASPEEEAPN